MRRYLFILSLFLIGNSLNGQELGAVKIRTVPVLGDLYIKSGDSLITKPNIVLPAGDYLVTLWASGYIPFDTTIQVISDTTIFFRKQLSQTPEYKSYLSDLGDYKKKVVRPKQISIWASIGLIATTGGFYLSLKKDWRRVLDTKSSYENFASTQVSSHRKLYENSIVNYNRKKKQFYGVSIATTVGLSAISYILLKKRKHKKPVFQEVLPPFRLSYSPDYENKEVFVSGGHWLFSVDVKF